MEITVTIQGTYSDGQKFSCTVDSIERANQELEMVKVNEHAFDHLQAAELHTSANIAQSNMLGEERLVSAKITDEQIDAYILEMMKSNPVRFVQYCLVVIGRDLFQSNAADFKFSQESDLEKGRRFKIAVKGTIKEVTK